MLSASLTVVGLGLVALAAVAWRIAKPCAERPKPVDDKPTLGKSGLDFGHGTMEGREVRG